MAAFAGVDVGGRRKGFHVAVVDRDGAVVGAPSRWTSVAEVLAAVRDAGLVAVDSPRRSALAGERSRANERVLARAVCSIRYTPDEATLRAPHRSDYYGWVLQGLELFAALDAAGVGALECFPTASLTRWGGPRAGRSRAGWSSAVLAAAGVPNAAALGQDGRDAVVAALTARAHANGETEAFGDIVVPCPR